MGSVRRHPIWSLARADFRRLARRWWAWLPAAVAWGLAAWRTLPALDHPHDGWLAVLVHHGDEVWVGLPVIVGLLVGTSWGPTQRGSRLDDLAGTLLARAGLVVAALVPPAVALGALSSTLGGDYVPRPGVDAHGLAAWGSVRGAAMLLALVAGGLALVALMACVKVLTGSAVLAVALPVAAYVIAVWFLPTTIEQVFLITSDWPWPGGVLAFWSLVVVAPAGCALALAGRANPGPVRPTP